jgi:dihydroflavonol-4-reductase
MNQNILITGGSGLLGSYLVRWFRQKGYTRITATYQYTADTIPLDIRDGVRWISLSLPDKEATYDLVDGHDWVVHTAGMISYKSRDRYRMLDVNQTGTEHIVNACLAHKVTHLVYVGSIASLGRETDHVTLTERSPWLDNEFSSGYGLSKYLGELEVWRGVGEELKASVVLPSVILGAGPWHRSSLQLVDRIVNKPGWYPGGQGGFVDVRDVARFIVMLLEKSMIGERWVLNGVNMAHGDLYTAFGRQLELKKTFREAPKWLAQAILMAGGIFSSGSFGTEMLNQAYGTFTYDASKSLSMESFQYRTIEETIREISRAYKEGKTAGPLPI